MSNHPTKQTTLPPELLPLLMPPHFVAAQAFLDDVETEYHELQARFDADHHRRFGHWPDEFDWRSFRIVAGWVAAFGGCLALWLLLT